MKAIRYAPVIIALLVASFAVVAYVRWAGRIYGRQGWNGVVEAGAIGLGGFLLIGLGVTGLIGIAFSYDKGEMMAVRWFCILLVALSGPAFIAELITRYL